MDDLYKIIAGAVTAVLLCFGTRALIGAMQQSGYKNTPFFRWLKGKENLFFNRLAVLSLCLFLAAAVACLCFSFLGVTWALICSAVPFFGLCFAFAFSSGKYALKVPLKNTGRSNRLFVAYLVLTAAVGCGIIYFLWWLSEKNGSYIYGLLAYLPFAIMPMLLPVILGLANGILSVFENARNKKFVKRAGQVLDECQITRIGVVGSFGKTSVKNILKTILSEKYSVVATPESFNTPMGIAKTVCSPDFDNKQIFIAEMGARKAGDIAELCGIVKPDYAVFTGVCEQHIQGFGSLDNIWREKSEILRCGAKKVVCGAGLKPYLEQEFSEEIGKTVFIDDEAFEADMGAAATAFTMRIFGETVEMKTVLLGKMAVENIRLAVYVALELGLTADEIVRCVEKLKPIPHRLQLIENGGVYILDDGYNCNPKGADEAIAALKRFLGRKYIVTPGIVECGILEEKINGALGEKLANAGFDKIILVGNTLVNAVKNGYEKAGGDTSALMKVETLQKAQDVLKGILQEGDAVLFLNDLPDVY